jgi:hypothetical protein
MTLPKIAVFIDADNVHVRGISSALLKLEEDWNVTYRRAYGRGLISKVDVFREHGIVPVEVMYNTPGKNAADIALIIDAMSELHAGRVDAFCLVTGDGDFTRLATTVRENGVPVIVFGGHSTPMSLRSACTEFHPLGDISNASTKQNSLPPRKVRSQNSKEPDFIKDRAEFEGLVRDLLDDGHGRTSDGRNPVY